MNLLEITLQTTAEECGELSQILLKTTRFGLESSHPFTGEHNKVAITREFADVLAMMRLVENLGGADFPSEEMIQTRIAKFQESLKRSEATGAYQPHE